MSYRRRSRTLTGEIDSKWHAHVEIRWEKRKELPDHLLVVAKHRTNPTPLSGDTAAPSSDREQPETAGRL